MMEQKEMFPAVTGNSPAHHSQVMSAFIKCIRLRRTDDAVYWFTHFNHFWPKEQFRLTRRILICSAEDCIDVPVQKEVAAWFIGAINQKDRTAWYRGAVAKIHLICATRNWWWQPTGRRYVVRWTETERTLGLLPELTKSELVKLPVDFDKEGVALIQHMLLNAGFEDYKARGAYAAMLEERARTTENMSARLSAGIHRKYAKLLGKDENFTGQALYKLAGGSLGINAYPAIKAEDVRDSVHKALTRLKNPEKTPSWTHDGIHCYGKDRRFAGVLRSMVGCCNAFSHYGRLDPADEFTEEMYELSNVSFSHKLL
jgi:hypothetical protein